MRPLTSKENKVRRETAVSLEVASNVVMTSISPTQSRTGGDRHGTIVITKRETDRTSSYKLPLKQSLHLSQLTKQFNEVNQKVLKKSR